MSDGGEKRWASRSGMVSTVLGMREETASHGQVFWSQTAVSCHWEICFSKTGLIWFQS